MLSDLKSCTYAVELKVSAFMVRHPSFSEATCLPFANRHAKPLLLTTVSVGPEGADLQIPNSPVGRGLYGPTSILSRSDMHPLTKRHDKPLRHTTDNVGPEGADLQRSPMAHWAGLS